MSYEVIKATSIKAPRLGWVVFGKLHIMKVIVILLEHFFGKHSCFFGTSVQYMVHFESIIGIIGFFEAKLLTISSV